MNENVALSPSFTHEKGEKVEAHIQDMLQAYMLKLKYILGSQICVRVCVCDEVKMNVCSYVMVYSCGASKTHCVYCYLVCWLCICSLLHQSEYYLHLLSFTHSFIHSFIYTLTKLLSFSFVCFTIVLFYKKYCSRVCLKQKSKKTVTAKRLNKLFPCRNV